MKWLLALVLALAAPMAFAQSFQSSCQRIGFQTICNGTVSNNQFGGTLQAVPLQDYGAMLGLSDQASMMNAQSQAQLAQQQAKLVAEQAETLRAQRQALEQQTRTVVSAPPTEAQAQLQHDQVLSAVHADTTDGLRAKAATLEAVQRNSPPDSEVFRNATGALLIVNEELAKRGELK
jgi:hypothetical protein